MSSQIFVQTPPGSSTHIQTLSTNTGDIHICGTCKQNFTDLNCFIEHKQHHCNSLALSAEQKDSTRALTPVSERSTSEYMTTNSNDNGIALVTPPVFRVFLESSHVSQVTTQQETRLVLQHLRTQGTLEESLLLRSRLLEAEREEIPSDISKCSDTNPSELQHIVSPQSQQSKRDFQLDDEDVAAILANQLANEVISSSTPSLFREELIRQRSSSPGPQNVFLSGMSHAQEDRSRNMTLDETPLAQSEIVIGHYEAIELEPLQDTINNPLISVPEMQFTGVSETVQSLRVKKRHDCQVAGCNFSSSYLKDLIRHTRTHTGERPFRCSLCPRAFGRRDKLQLHQRIHAGIKSHCCGVCNYATVDSGSLRKHVRIHNDERPFKCQICSYRSRDSSQLTVHLRTHTGDNPFACPYESCSSAFKTSSDLKRHIRTHTGCKPYGCDDCDYRSAVKSNLRVHIKLNHTVVKSVLCVTCDHIAPSKRAAKEHGKLHAEMVLKCGVCTFSCVSGTGMRNHLKIHTQEKPVLCKHCFYSCRHESYLKRHMKNKHSDLKTNKNRTQSQPSKDDQHIENSQKTSVHSKPFGFKSYQCTYCDSAFVREDSWRSHVRQHKSKPSVDKQTVIAESGESEYAFSAERSNHTSTHCKENNPITVEHSLIITNANTKENNNSEENKETCHIDSQQQILSSSCLPAQPMYLYLQNEGMSEILFSNRCSQYVTIPSDQSNLVEQLSVSLQSGGMQYVLSGPISDSGFATNLIEADVAPRGENPTDRHGASFLSEKSTVIKKF